MAGRPASKRPVPRCPIRPGDACTLCFPGATGPEDCGLVWQVMQDPDLRARLAELTGEGRSRLAMIQAAQRPWASQIGAAAGERDLRRATETLDRLIALLG